MAAHGLEIRVPFFDKKFVEYSTNICVENKSPSYHNIEKKILRDAFKSFYLPQEIISRQKNGMSDAVGYSWVDYIKEKLGDQEKNYYLEFYNTHYSKLRHIFYDWMPKWTDVDDPSARQIKDIFVE